MLKLTQWFSFTIANQHFRKFLDQGKSLGENERKVQEMFFLCGMLKSRVVKIWQAFFGKLSVFMTPREIK